jgi:GNAT superfamily N-acetyltransferase
MNLIESSSTPHDLARLAKRSEAADITVMLAQAFVDDPVVSHVMRNVNSRNAWHEYFRVGVDVAFDQGEVWTMGDIAGACLYVAPNHWHISAWTELKAAYRIARASGVATTLNVRTIFHALEAAQPSQRHYYLLAVGVSLDHRNRGIGAKLLRPMLESCDRDHAPAYLENSNPTNHHFYEQRGFERIRSLTLPNGAPPVDLMWRAAGRADYR